MDKWVDSFHIFFFSIVLSPTKLDHSLFIPSHLIILYYVCMYVCAVPYSLSLSLIFLLAMKKHHLSLDLL